MTAFLREVQEILVPAMVAGPVRGMFRNAPATLRGIVNMQDTNENVSFYGEFYCGNCDLTWEFDPQDDGTTMVSFHECEEEE